MSVCWICTEIIQSKKKEKAAAMPENKERAHIVCVCHTLPYLTHGEREREYVYQLKNRYECKLNV